MPCALMDCGEMSVPSASSTLGFGRQSTLLGKFSCWLLGWQPETWTRLWANLLHPRNLLIPFPFSLHIYICSIFFILASVHNVFVLALFFIIYRLCITEELRIMILYNLVLRENQSIARFSNNPSECERVANPGMEAVTWWLQKTL